MTQVHFDRAGVQRLLEHAKQAPEHTGGYSDKPPFSRGLFLAGDHGVYLMSNGKPNLQIEGGKPNQSFVVYAREIDPTTLPFDTWWEAKRRIFGRDDGADLVPLDAIETALATYRPDEPLILDITTNGISVVLYRVKAATPKPPGRTRR